MATIIHISSVLFASLALLPAWALAVQAILALSPRRHRWRGVATRQVRCTVLIPAHNEQDHIEQTIQSVANNAPGARILVVADNCQDDTVQRARSAGAEVTERRCPTQLGKAFALGHGVRHLRSNQVPDVVVVIDADARVKGMSFESLGALAVTLDRPVQALNVIDRCRGQQALSALTILGNRLHNVVRPLAMQRLGCPCLLMGSGMAFPWHLAERVGLDNASLGEDKRLGIDMMLAGHAPVFCLETKVASPVAEHGRGYLGQRTRWEQGHLLVAAWALPRLAWYAVRRGKPAYLATALELAVPPMALLATVWTLAAAMAVTDGLINHNWFPVAGVLSAAGLLWTALLITWFGFARHRVPAKSFFGIPGYLLAKIPIYVALLRDGPQQVWRRTERSNRSKPEVRATRNT